MSKQPTTKPSTGSTTGFHNLSPSLQEAKTTDPVQWNIQIGIVTAAYEHALKGGKENTIKYMEKVMDDYGIERGIPQ